MKGEGPWDLHFSTCINLYINTHLFLLFSHAYLYSINRHDDIDFLLLDCFCFKLILKGKRTSVSEISQTEIIFEDGNCKTHDKFNLTLV